MPVVFAEVDHTPAGRRITIPVTVNRQNGATGPRPALDRVEYSVDDGATWVRVEPRKNPAGLPGEVRRLLFG